MTNEAKPPAEPGNEAIIEAILRREGSRFVDRREDRGGPTKFGITLKTLSEWRGARVSAGDVAFLSEAEARAIYRALYIERPRFDAIRDPLLRALVVDTGVLHGPERATIWLQASLGGLQMDGILGAATRRAVNGLDEAGTRRLRARFLATRYRTYGSIVASDVRQAVFLRGWIERANEFLMEL